MNTVEVEKILLKSVTEAFKVAEKLCEEQGVRYGSLFTYKSRQGED